MGFVKNCMWARKAIIEVWSLNYKEGHHVVYWDGYKVHDPSTKKTYKTLQEVEPITFILFNDVKINAVTAEIVK
jgi:hypothetical protein